MYIRQVKYPLFLSEINETWIFSSDIRKILKYHISLKPVQWEPSCSMRTDRHDETNSRFSQLCQERLTTLLTPNVYGQHLLMLKVGNRQGRNRVGSRIYIAVPVFRIALVFHHTYKWFARLVHIWKAQGWNPVANYPDPRSSWFLTITRGKCSDSTSNYGTTPPSTSLPIHYLHCTNPRYAVWHKK
jgi:hypothetical protein